MWEIISQFPIIIYETCQNNANIFYKIEDFQYDTAIRMKVNQVLESCHKTLQSNIVSINKHNFFYELLMLNLKDQSDF